MLKYRSAATMLAVLASSPGAMAQDSDVQKQLANPIASLTLIPIQVNYDRGIGPAGDGYKVTTNLQPVIPVKLNSDWTLVTRTIIPIIGQSEVFPGAGDQFGLGDTLQSFFFVPRTVDGFTWGLGPVFLWRTGTDKLLSTGKWAAGPTAVALQQTGPWTVGLLANHIWSFEGADDRADVNSVNGTFKLTQASADRQLESDPPRSAA
ncbi:MAG: hypothetical protein KJ587_12065 [Alphaproteobacteria bacterium]|nr:hypothetical protein [Alphaproteobacteria bacterium]